MRLGTVNRIKKIERTLQQVNFTPVMVLRLEKGKYYFGENEIDINNISATVVIVNDIPRTPPPDSCKKKRKRGEPCEEGNG